MTNFELQLEFEKIFKLSNCFDAYIQLKQLNKLYKKSEFYKQTRLSIKRAYNLFIQDKIKQIITFLHLIRNPEQVGDLITEYIDNIDSETIGGLIDKISSMLDINNLKQLQGEVNTVFDKFKLG